MHYREYLTGKKIIPGAGDDNKQPKNGDVEKYERTRGDCGLLWLDWVWERLRDLDICVMVSSGDMMKDKKEKNKRLLERGKIFISAYEEPACA